MIQTLSERDITEGPLAGLLGGPAESPEVLFAPDSFSVWSAALPTDELLYGASIHPLLRTVRAFPVRFERREDSFVAIVPELEEFGVGSTRSEALNDLRQTLAELYFSLARDEDRLSEELRRVWRSLQTHLVRTRT